MMEASYSGIQGEHSHASIKLLVTVAELEGGDVAWCLSSTRCEMGPLLVMILDAWEFDLHQEGLIGPGPYFLRNNGTFKQLNGPAESCSNMIYLLKTLEKRDEVLTPGFACMGFRAGECCHALLSFLLTDFSSVMRGRKSASFSPLFFPLCFSITCHIITL